MLVPENRALQLTQTLARLDPELVDEHTTSLLIDTKSLGLAAAPIEREHELAAKPLAQRVS